MATLSATEVRYLSHIRDIIRERGAEFVYDPLVEADSDSCVYRGDLPGTGSCLIGKLLIEKLDVDPSLIREGVMFGPAMASEVVDYSEFSELGSDFLFALGSAQTDQDGGMPYREVWQKLLNRLERYLYIIDREEWEL